MSLSNELKLLVEKQAKESFKRTLEKSGLNVEKPKPMVISTPIVNKLANKLNEALVLMPRTFLLKTEKLSGTTKQSHENLYKNYIEAFNKLSISLDAVDKEEAKSTTSAYRSLKVDETVNFNSIKLHELYFANISDLASQISVDSFPYMKLARDYGTFENWQFDFMACAMSARNGWAVTVFEPYRDRYMNVVIDGHDVNVPVGSIPVVVLDMWEHAYYRDYMTDKKSYIIGMMKELNWDVIEARMMVAEHANLANLYRIEPIINNAPEQMLTAAQEAGNQAPIKDIAKSSGQPGHLAPTNPPDPATQSPGVLAR